MKLINASLMIAGAPNGFTTEMCKLGTEGYWEIPPGEPSFNERLIKATLENKPDLIFLQLQAPSLISEETLRIICENSFVVQFSGDIRVESPPQHYLEIAKYCHLSLFSNMKDVLGCRQLGFASEWLELGFDPERFRKWEDVPKTKDIVAHFNDYGETAFPLSKYRLDIVSALSKEFGDRFGVFGNFPNAAGNFNVDQIAESKNYAAAKLAINCSHFETEKYSSDRLSRILGTGGATCLTHYFHKLEEMYELYEHLVPFYNISDLIQKCHYYLENKEDRLKIAAAGQKHALENYTFKHMCENTFAFYKKYKNQ